VRWTSDGVGTNAIVRRTGKSKTGVWRWQERFIEEGFDGLLGDKTRPSRIKPLGEAVWIHFDVRIQFEQNQCFMLSILVENIHLT
jgi:winged helix-turn helix protein